MQVTIKDVAKMAGVAPSTVSRVIADSPKISDATKKIVEKAMKELNYQPNIIARSLANRKTYTLGLILPSNTEEIFENPFFIQAMRGLSKYAQQKGYYIMYNYCHSIEDELKTAETFIRSKWVDGIILLTSRIEDPCVHYLMENKHQVVVIGRPEDYKDKALWVDNDNVRAMYEVVCSLIRDGHKKIAFFGGEQQFTVNRHRLRGYKNALEDNGLIYDENLVFENEPTEIKAFKSMELLLKTQTPDAIVGTDDTVAYGAFNAALAHHIKDIAAVGFNNTPMAMYKTPSLSTVDINAELLGSEAARLLISRIENEELDSNYSIVESDYIERSSTLDSRRV